MIAFMRWMRMVGYGGITRLRTIARRTVFSKETIGVLLRRAGKNGVWLMRLARNNRVDINQHEIVVGLRQIPGCEVYSMHAMGDGFPDILVAYKKWYPMEVKSAKGKLTPAQRKWRLQCPIVVPIVRSLDDALRVIGVIWMEEWNYSQEIKRIHRKW